jgi:hypothetical protein
MSESHFRVVFLSVTLLAQAFVSLLTGEAPETTGNSKYAGDSLSS